MKTHLFIASPLFLAARISAFADNLNPKGEGCVDPDGYLQCYKDNVAASTACVEKAKATCGTSLQECITACGEVQLAANLACWLDSCWNMVYSCAYQGTAIQYLSGADRVQGSINIPFYPPPDHAPGSCVCNLGYIFGNFTVTFGLGRGNPCGGDVLFKGAKTEADCQCCWDSSILSNIIRTCPKNDFGTLGTSTMLGAFLSGNNNSASNNCQVLNDGGATCRAQFQLDDSSAGKLYNPGALPSGFPGAEPLSDLGSLTTVPFAAPYTLELFPAFTSTITPAANKGQVTGAGGAAAKTQTGVAGSQTSKSGGVQWSSDLSWTAGMAMLALFCLV